VTLVYPVLILELMTWFFLLSLSGSLVHYDLLFLSFISLLLSFHLSFHDSIAFVVSHLAKSSGGYVSVGYIASPSAVFASMFAISFPVIPILKDTFSPFSTNIFLSIRVFGFFVSTFSSSFLVVYMAFIMASCSALYIMF
jgi:hypothetical protein